MRVQVSISVDRTPSSYVVIFLFYFLNNNSDQLITMVLQKLRFTGTIFWRISHMYIVDYLSLRSALVHIHTQGQRFNAEVIAVITLESCKSTAVTMTHETVTCGDPLTERHHPL